MKDAFLEAVFVVMGVILALGANEWREQVSDQRAAARAYDSIVQEIRLNEAAVRGALEYHESNLGKMQQRNRDGEVLTMEVFIEGFMRTAQLSRVAWESASETGALANMDYEAVLKLGGAYARQERYNAQAESAAAIIYREIFDNGAAGLVKNPTGLASLISASAYSERDLLERYDETLGAL